MIRSFKVSLLLLALLAASASHAGFKSKAFTPPAGEPIKTIGLLKVGEPRGYFLGEGGGSGASFGFGGIFYETFKKPNHPEYTSAGFYFSAEAERVLTAHLKAAGFKVIVVPVKRDKPYQLVDDYNALSVPHVDAYLDIASWGVGYRKSTFSAFPGAARKVGPVVNVIVRLVSARTKKVLYADTLEYGWDSATVGNAGIEIDAPDDHIFKNTDALETDLMSGQGSRGLTQLTQGIDVVMRRVVSEFSAYPATGRPLQAGTTPDSPIDIAKAAPAATPSPGAAISGWRQKPITDFQTIAGKWEGSGLTAKREAFDLEITYQQDGSYTFRANRGTPRTARGTRIAGGILKGKSYTTGDPVTVALYEDEHGNHVLKAHRADGLTWTVAKTEYALSSFIAAGGAKVKPAPMAAATGTTPKPAPGTTSSTTVAKAAPAATPSPGAAIPKGTAYTAYKIAIFPFGGNTPCMGANRATEQKIAAEIAAFLARDNSVELVYSQYDSRLNRPPIEKPEQLWKGSKINLARVSELGERQGVDAVIMYWRPDDSPGIVYCSGRMPPYQIKVYFVDVKQKKIYQLKGREENHSAMTKQALSKFLEGAKPKVVAMPPPTAAIAKTAPAAASPTRSAQAATPTKRREVTSSQTASAASPFEGITLRPGGSVEAINAAAEAYCGSLNKKSRLIAAPPNHPDYVFQCYQPTKAAQPTTTAKAAPHGAATNQKSVSAQLRKETGRYKVAIFPFGGDTRCDGWNRPRSSELASNARALIQQNESLTLVTLPPTLSNPKSLWERGRRPNAQSAYSIGKDSGVDVILTYWRSESLQIYCSDNAPPYPVDVYLFDVAHQRTYRKTGAEKNLLTMTEQALSEFLAGRR